MNAINESGTRLVLREVPGTLGRLYASECGRIFGRRKEITPEITSGGYLRAIYYDPLSGKTRKVLWHRAVLSAFTAPSDMQVNHIDGNKNNNAVSNLEWCTQSDNMLHAEALGLHRGRKRVRTS